MSNHSEKNISDAVQILKAARAAAERELEDIGEIAKPAKRVAA
jgi:hypothetical protein